MPSLLLLLLFASAASAAEPVPPAKDGWCGPNAGLVLEQTSPLSALVIRGTVPALGQDPFHPRLRVTIDGNEVCSGEIGPGDFEMRGIAAGGSGDRTIAWELLPVRPLPLPDGREVGALIRGIYFEPTHASRTGWMPSVGGSALDIAVPNGPVALGTGWNVHEVWAGEGFRWMGAKAQIGLAATGRIRLRWNLARGSCLAPAGTSLRLTDREGRLIDMVRIDHDGSYDSIFEAPQVAQQPLNFEVTDPLPPQSGDVRQLCLRFLSLLAERVDP